MPDNHWAALLRVTVAEANTKAAQQRSLAEDKDAVRSRTRNYGQTM